MVKKFIVTGGKIIKPNLMTLKGEKKNSRMLYLKHGNRHLKFFFDNIYSNIELFKKKYIFNSFFLNIK